jgi:hypothetical protein
VRDRALRNGSLSIGAATSSMAERLMAEIQLAIVRSVLCTNSLAKDGRAHFMINILSPGKLVREMVVATERASIM